MERFTYCELEVQKIQEDLKYSPRYSDALLESGRGKFVEAGLMLPVILTDEQSPQIVSGFRRVATFRANSESSRVPCLCIQGNVSDQDLWLFSVFNNHSASYSYVDRCFILKKSKDEFQLPDEMILEVLLPWLNIPASRHNIDDCLSVANSSDVALQMACDGKLPEKALLSLSHFQADAQETLARDLLEPMNWSASECQKALEWFADLLHGDKDVKDLIQEILVAVPSPDASDNNQLKEYRHKVLLELYKRRYPRLVEHEQRFKQALHEAGLPKPYVSVERGDAFEKAGLHLSVKLRDKEALRSLREYLDDKNKELNSLFDIIL